MQVKKIIQFGNQVAVGSFLLGTSIFLIHYWTDNDQFKLLGLAYIFVAAIINTGLLITLLATAVKVKAERWKILRTCCFMLLNVPVMLIYVWMFFALMNIVRLSVMNDTNHELTDIKFSGCGEGQLETLKPGQTRTVWLSIVCEGSIFVEFDIHGVRKRETAVGYTTKGMGGKEQYKISVNEMDE